MSTQKKVTYQMIEEAEKLSREKGMVFVHPFDDPYVIAGQGTIGKVIFIPGTSILAT